MAGKQCGVYVFLATICANSVFAQDSYTLDMTYAEAWNSIYGTPLVRDLAVGERGNIDLYYVCREGSSLKIPLDTPLTTAKQIESGVGGELEVTRAPQGTATIKVEPSNTDVLRLIRGTDCAGMFSGFNYDEGSLTVTSVNEFLTASEFAASIKSSEQ